MSERPPITIQQQADFVNYLVERAGALNGWKVYECWMLLTADEIGDLRMLGERLMRMAPHEPAIRELVTGQ